MAKEALFLYACRVTKNIKVIEYLIKQGADTKAKTIYGNNALFVAAEYNKNWKVVEYLINTKLYDINSKPATGLKWIGFYTHVAIK